MVLRINTIGERPSSTFDAASNKLLPPMINFIDLSTPRTPTDPAEHVADRTPLALGACRQPSDLGHRRGARGDLRELLKVGLLDRPSQHFLREVRSPRLLRGGPTA